jgi:predicted RNA-binding protein (virulence factor B family)
MYIGRMNHLTVLKHVDFGVYLDGEEEGEILLPARYVPKECKIDDEVEVFVYSDSDDRLVAVTQQPYAMVGECAFLKVVAVNRVGAFLDWGLPKDLLVPYNEQHVPMVAGQSYVVCVYLDNESKRIAASSTLHHFLEEINDDFEEDEAVSLMIISRSDLGYKAVINHSHLGLIFHDEVFQPLKAGQTLPGFIKRIRDDGKIDLKLQHQPEKSRDDLSQRILDYLEAEGGASTLTDKCAPNEIYNQFQVSKSSYKKALGALYKNKKILIEKHQISLLQ